MLINLPIMVLNFVFGKSDNGKLASTVLYAFFFSTTSGNFGDFQTEKNDMRTTMVFVTLVTDIVVLLVFTYHIFFTWQSIRRETKRLDIFRYDMNDFGVRISGISKTVKSIKHPEMKDYPVLKEILTRHI